MSELGDIQEGQNRSEPGGNQESQAQSEPGGNQQSQAQSGEVRAVPARFFSLLSTALFLMIGLFFASAVPGWLGFQPMVMVASEPTPRPTATAPMPTATPRPIRVYLPTPTPVAPTATATAPVQRVKVGNTGGEGVALRRTPHMNDRLLALPDNTILEIIGPDETSEGINWKHVRDPRGNVGYVPAQYTVPAS